MKDKKRLAQILFFAILAGITLYMICVQQNIVEVWGEIQKIPIFYILCALACGVGFVCMEGGMIWKICRSMEQKGNLLSCIKYSFIGFFYSGITPSATGGQPMQLYYMCRDGKKGVDATLVLMTVGLFYKLVLVVGGAGLFLLWRSHIYEYLGNYNRLFFVGLLLNAIVVLFILALMIFPQIMERIACRFLEIFCRRKSVEKQKKVHAFIESYRQAFQALLHRPLLLIEVFIMTFVQRLLLFLIPAWIFLGIGGDSSLFWHIVGIQASVYLAVDLLPLPGSQGITELMYQSVMGKLFGKQYLMASLLLTRFFSFYLILVFSFVVVCVCAKAKNKSEGCKDIQ